MKFPKKISLAQLPTPIEPLKKFPHPAHIFIKRDDLTGLLGSGNKARKAEYLLADAKAKNADTIISYGPNQSNHCRTLAAYAAYLGLKITLLLRGKDDKPYEGNLLLDHLLGAQVIHITPQEYKSGDLLMEKVAFALVKKGQKPYLITEGGSNEIGLWGYVECMAEMRGFVKKERIQEIYAPVGSGGTYAGMILGKKIFQIKADVIGIIVCDTVSYFREKIYTICQKAIERFNLNVTLDRDEIKLVDGYVGKGYGITYPEEIKTIRNLAKYGILLDPVYGGKAFYGMLKEIAKPKRVIFIATGGIFSLFAYKNDLFPSKSSSNNR
jgi:D-cysteine desulfhydrase